MEDWRWLRCRRGDVDQCRLSSMSCDGFNGEVSWIGGEDEATNSTMEGGGDGEDEAVNSVDEKIPQAARIRVG